MNPDKDRYISHVCRPSCWSIPDGWYTPDGNLAELQYTQLCMNMTVRRNCCDIVRMVRMVTDSMDPVRQSVLALAVLKRITNVQSPNRSRFHLLNISYVVVDCIG